MSLTFGELFAGIGGFSLGLERAGMTCKWQVEIDPYATAVLRKHWPDVPKHDDVRTFPPQGDWGVDIICGGFPCQDISYAGKGAGLAGARSGLWHEFARVIGELRPRYVVVENVAALLTRGMDAVIGTLSTLGYDAEWHVIPASAVGAPHRRERVWIVAYANDQGESDVPVHDVSRRGVQEPSSSHVADPESGGSERHRPIGQQVSQPQAGSWLPRCGGTGEGESYWSAEPGVGVLADGFPNRLAGWGDCMRGLGNAVVPQVVEIIGRAILAAETRMTA